MLDAVCSWFNGSRDYNHGVLLFTAISENDDLKNFFQKNASDYTMRRLNEEMEKVYNRLKQPVVQEIKAPTPPAAAKSLPKNMELEQACDQAALQLYKQMMNDRAVLFNLTKIDAWDDINKPDLVEQRRVLALQVCTTNYQVSQAYDVLAFVREHGKLPDTEESENSTEISDAQVKPTIDNLRKNLGKLRRREQTPERIALIQKHMATLEELEKRWNKIKKAHEK